MEYKVKEVLATASARGFLIFCNNQLFPQWCCWLCRSSFVHVICTEVTLKHWQCISCSQALFNNAHADVQKENDTSKVPYVKRITYVQCINTPYLIIFILYIYIYLCHWVCLLALPWNHSSNDHVFPFWFRVSSSGWPQHQSFIFKARIKGHQLYWKVSVSFSHRSSQRGIRYLSEAEPDNVFPPAPVSPPLHDPARSRVQPADAFSPPAASNTWSDESFRSFASDQFYVLAVI